MARILVVDDDPVIRQFLRDVLEKLLGHTVTEASSLQKVLQLGSPPPVDFIFLDQTLPDGTALDVCQALSQLSGWGEVPKWLITGEKPLEWDPELWSRFKVRGYTVKPIRIDQIEKILNKELR